MATKPLRIAALLNQSAGVVRNKPALSADLSSAFQRHGISATVDLLPGRLLQTAAEKALREAKQGRLDAVVAGGGDGSIRSVAGVLAGTGIPMGILPLGTLNHFARDLGVPPALDQAVTVIAKGTTRFVDVGEVNGEIFINNSSIGIYPSLVADRDRRREMLGMRKWTAMALATWRTLRSFPLRRLSVCAGESVEPYRSPCVFVANNEYELALPVPGKRTRLDDGTLCLYIAKPESRLSLFWLACRTLIGFVDRSLDLRVQKVTQAQITSRASRLLVAVDGEVTVLRSPLNFRTRPGALAVFAPAHVDNA